MAHCFCRLTLVVFAVVCLLPWSDGWANEPTKPNIIWIIGEDIGPDLGCWGTKVRTPNIDRLAQEGMRFTHMFGTASVCMPNRTAMITGVTQSTLGAVTMRPPKRFMRPLPPGVKPLPVRMRELGYLTANIRDKELGCSAKDDWNFQYEDKTWDTNRLQDLESEQPFYAQFNFFMSHRPFKQDKQFPVDPNTVDLPPYYPDHPVTRKSWADYLESIQNLDRDVGKVLDWLEEKRLAENTIVFFLSDHGEAFLRGKYFLYDCSLNQPLIVRWPLSCDPSREYEVGSTSDRLIASIDIAAQTVACGGGSVPASMHGRPFLGNDLPPREVIFSAADWYGDSQLKSRSLRSRRYKYIRNFNTQVSVWSASTIYRKAMHPLYHLVEILAERGELLPLHGRLLMDPLPEEELYDLEGDPHELRNLADDSQYEELREKLDAQLSDWIDQSGDLGFEPLEAGHIKFFEDYRKRQGQALKKKVALLRNKVLSNTKSSDMDQ